MTLSRRQPGCVSAVQDEPVEDVVERDAIGGDALGTGLH
jgi:hypothetical protein